MINLLLPLLTLLSILLIFPATLTASPAQTSPSDPKILFVRGGPGTGGFLEGGSDDQLSSISDASTSNGNHGWATLASELEALGFILEEKREEPVVDGVPTPLPFDEMDLSVYRIIVLGSNNAAYSPAQVDAVEDFIRAGGGVLFISDANFGQDWPDAPTSDQAFLDRLGLIMNQDRGTYAITEDEFLAPTHPILQNVSAFDGEGVSPVTLGSPPSDTNVEMLARAEGQVRRNDSESGQGSSTAATDRDAVLLYGSAGEGRFVVHFDRNTFFNENGAGTDITRLDNRTFARNLFRWLAGETPLPVELNGFGGVFSEDSVVLTWETLSEDNHAGFGVERGGQDAPFKQIGFVPGQGSVSTPETYRFVDADPPASPTIGYRLRLVSTDGTEQFSPIVRVTRTISSSGLKKVNPSPLRRSTHVEYVLATESDVDLSLYDITGRLVTRLRRGRFGPGQWQFPLRISGFPSGQYFLRLTVDREVYTQPVTLIR